MASEKDRRLMIRKLAAPLAGDTAAKDAFMHQLFFAAITGVENADYPEARLSHALNICIYFERNLASAKGFASSDDKV